MPPQDVIKRYPTVSAATIYRHWENLRHAGTLYLRPQASTGRHRLITRPIETDLIDLVSRRPTLYLDEIVYHILITWGLHVSEATVSRALARSEVSRKVTQRVAAQRNDVRRMEYYMNIDHYTPEQLVYVDESAANERTLDRKYGWAPKGLPAIDFKLLHRSTRWSILPAYTIDGYLPQPLVIQGSVTGELFVNWLEDSVLPQCAPYPGPRSVLVMDNCSTHKVDVRTFIRFTSSKSANIT